MSSRSKVATIDLSASEARLKSAQVLAERQLRVVEAAAGGADKHAIDMFFLLHESVLVLTETHAMLERSAREPAGASRRVALDAAPARPARTRASRHAAVAALVFLVALVASACALEIIDPAPMGALAALTGWP